MSVSTRPMTADEFLAAEFEPGTRHELIRGEVRRLEVPGEEHGDVAMEAGWRIKSFVKLNPIGKVYAAETGFVIELGPDTVRAPDVSFVRFENLPEGRDRTKFLPCPPDLAVEVASPTDRRSAIAEKTARWLASGTAMVWNFFPKTKSATVHRPGAEPVELTAEDEIDGGDVLPGFRCRVGDFFE